MTGKIILSAAMMTVVFLGLPNLSAAALEPGEGYDENTEITVRGTVRESLEEVRGPVILRIAHGERTYNVITAPRWYLRMENICFERGLEAEVTGSKVFASDGTLYIIARTVRVMKTGAEIVFRDNSLRPLWHRHMRNHMMR